MKRYFIFISLLLLAVSTLKAQEIPVSGKVVSTVDDEPMKGTFVYIFKTEEDGEAAYKEALECFKNNELYLGPPVFRDVRVNPDGTYEFNAQANGSLLFCHDYYRPEFVKIGGRNEIPLVKINTTFDIDEAALSVVVEKKPKRVKKGPPPVGSLYSFLYSFDADKLAEAKVARKKNLKILSQVYLTTGDGSDTLMLLEPRVSDVLGRDLDTLHLIGDFPLVFGNVMVTVRLEDSKKTYYQDTQKLFTLGRLSRPFQFLEYTFEPMPFDPQKYYKAPSCELLSSSMEMQLQFLMGKDELDKSDAVVVANQVLMMMRSKEYTRAVELSSIIEKEHPLLYAIARCLGGFIDFDNPAEKADVELIKKSSPRNEVIVNLFTGQFDSTTVAALNRLPQEDPVTKYLWAQYLSLRYEGDVMRMKCEEYDRTLDPSFSHPQDRIIHTPAPEDIEALKAEIKKLEDEIELDELLGISGTDSHELYITDRDNKKQILAKMERGEEVVIPFDGFTVYDAVKIYLEQCFALDETFVNIARADFDIPEELL